MTTERIWAEKYHPKSLEEYTFQSKELETLVRSFVEQGDIPHLMITGTPGTGKSALAKVLIHELGVDKADVLQINASVENGIDVVRERITNFCSTYPMGKYKVVLCEEADGFSVNGAQPALRNIIDQYGDIARFIFTANYEHKISAPLKSRTQHIIVDAFDEDAILDRVAFILESEGIEFEDSQVVFDHVDRYTPDLRKIIQSIQQSSKTGILSPPTGNKRTGEFLDKWEMIWKGTPTYKSLAPLIVEVDNSNFEAAYRIMYTNVQNMGDKALDAIVDIANYLYRSYTVSDQEINIHACLIKMFGEIE